MYSTDEYHPTTLVDLPPELLAKIISNDCITLKDRLNLRGTCTTMERAVAMSDYNKPKLYNEGLGLSIEVHHSYTSDRRSVWKTSVSGLFKKNIGCSVSDMSFCAHVLSRLFRRASFKRVQIWISSKIEEESASIIYAFLQLSNYLACDRLIIRDDGELFESSVFGIIANVKIRKDLELHLNNARIENEYLLDLPPLSSLELSTTYGMSHLNGPSETTLINDATFLALIAKYPRLRIRARVAISVESLIKAKKIFAERNHEKAIFIIDQELFDQVHPPIALGEFFYCVFNSKGEMSLADIRTRCSRLLSF